MTLDSGDKGLFIHEIYDLIPNNKQEEILRNLIKEKDTEKYIWASKSSINRLGHNAKTKDYDYEISLHSKWALNLKWSEN